jgi:hypothetical protein
MAGGGKRTPRLCEYLDGLDPDTVVLTEWRAKTGRAFATWAEGRGMTHHAAVTTVPPATGSSWRRAIRSRT